MQKSSRRYNPNYDRNYIRNCESTLNAKLSYDVDRIPDINLRADKNINDKVPQVTFKKFNHNPDPWFVDDSYTDDSTKDNIISECDKSNKQINSITTNKNIKHIKPIKVIKITRKTNCNCGKRDRNERCFVCRPNKFCFEHKKNKNNEPNRKSRCRDCKIGFCQIEGHKKRRLDRCEFCKSDQLLCDLDNKKLKLNCQHCYPDRFCEHDNQKMNCRQCETRRCGHGTLDKDRCRICTPNAYCPCGRVKSTCLKHNGSMICPHKKRKWLCQEEGCPGSSLCPCGKQKQSCEKHKGVDFCECNKKKKYCAIHGGSGLCKECKNHIGRIRFSGDCFYCFKIKHPNSIVTQRIKAKEEAVLKAIQLRFPQLQLIHDKIIEGGKSKRRPDILIHCGDEHVLDIEIDEHGHGSYGEYFEEIRTNEIAEDLKPKKLVVIRFNPDSYKNDQGQIVPSCFDYENGMLTVTDLKMADWTHRINLLFEEIEFNINNIPDENITTGYLFYTNKQSSDNEDEDEDENDSK